MLLSVDFPSDFYVLPILTFFLKFGMAVGGEFDSEIGLFEFVYKWT